MYEKLLEEYIDKYKYLLFKICKTYVNDCFECENIVQETYLSFYKNIHKYPNNNKDEIKKILCKIALNKCRDYLKSAYVRHVDLILEIECITNSYEMETAAYENEKKIFIAKMLNQLKEPYLSLLTEYYINNKNLDEISNKTGSSKQVIKTQIYRGKVKLKELILKNGGVDYFG